MSLTDRERLVVAVANALTIYSIRRSESALPPSTTPHGFVLDAVPDSVKPAVTAEMIDEVFAALSGLQSEPNGS